MSTAELARGYTGHMVEPNAKRIGLKPRTFSEERVPRYTVTDGAYVPSRTAEGPLRRGKASRAASARHLAVNFPVSAKLPRSAGPVFRLCLLAPTASVGTAVQRSCYS